MQQTNCPACHSAKIEHGYHGQTWCGDCGEEWRRDDLLGPCAKRQVRCTLVCDDGRRYVGENLCRNPQSVCPRGEDEDYTKCRTICQTIGHAEEVAMGRADDADVSGAICYLEGHWRACENCREQLAAYGVTDIRIGAPR